MELSMLTKSQLTTLARYLKSHPIEPHMGHMRILQLLAQGLGFANTHALIAQNLDWRSQMKARIIACDQQTKRSVGMPSDMIGPLWTLPPRQVALCQHAAFYKRYPHTPPSMLYDLVWGYPLLKRLHGLSIEDALIYAQDFWALMDPAPSFPERFWSNRAEYMLTRLLVLYAHWHPSHQILQCWTWFETLSVQDIESMKILTQPSLKTVLQELDAWSLMPSPTRDSIHRTMLHYKPALEIFF